MQRRFTGPRSAVGNNLGAPSSIPAQTHTDLEIDHEIISTSADSRRVVVSYKRKYVHEVLFNRLVKLAQERVWLGEPTVRHDHSVKNSNKKTNKQRRFNSVCASTHSVFCLMKRWSLDYGAKEVSNQTVRMRRLIQVFDERTSHLVPLLNTGSFTISE